MQDSRKLSIEEMPFHYSMMRVQAVSNLDPRKLLLWQFAFKATPDTCTCQKHEWNAFDLMLESVASGNHNWDFYRDRSAASEVPQTFRTALLAAGLTCPRCGQRSGPLQVLYNYNVQCCPQLPV